MGIDYGANGGVGIYFDDKLITKIKLAIENGSITPTDWDIDDDISEILDAIDTNHDVHYGSYGNHYSGDIGYLILMQAKTLPEAIIEAPSFIQLIKDKLGVDITIDDLKIIVEGTVS